MGERRKPARWRRVPVVVFGRVDRYEHELRRDGEVLATVKMGLGDAWYWVAGGRRSTGNYVSAGNAKIAAREAVRRAEASA